MVMRRNRIAAAGLALALEAGCGGTKAPMDVTLPPPSRGFQLATPAFAVAPGEELQSCYFFKVPDPGDGQPFYVERIEVAQNPGSHHMNIFRQRTVVNLSGPNADGTGLVASRDGKGECFKSANWADWPLVVNSQMESSAEHNYVMSLPPKVAHKFTPGEILMLQTHYVNATTQKTPGRGLVLANFEQMADPTGVMELGTLFATTQSITICKGDQSPFFNRFCKFNSPNQPIHVVAANGHFHSRGRDFTMCSWDGTGTDACKPASSTLFYQSTSWDDPPMVTGLDLLVPAGGGISYGCSYEWMPSPSCADGCSCLGDPTSCCYQFGGVVETSEHCNAFIYYYPKLNNTDIVCF